MKKSEFKILVAEDDAMVSDVMMKFLSEEGYSVVSSNDGLEAMKLLRLENIRMVLTDLRMPGADGMEVLRTAVQTNPKMPVVLITAYGTLDTALEAMKEGAYDYIVKPFVMQQLLLVVRNAYKMANLTEENENLSKQLKSMYRNADTARTREREENETAPVHSIERIRRLQELNIINSEEAAILIERSSTKTEGVQREQPQQQEDAALNESERVRQYGSLVKGLKTDSEIQAGKPKKGSG